jgi:DNA polymerase-1
MSFAVAEGEAAYLPLAHRYAAVPPQLTFDEALAKLRPWLESPRHAKLGQNLKYDIHVLANHGLRLEGVAHDTMLESYIVESDKNHDMDSMALRHLGIATIKYDEVTGKGAGRIGFEQVDIARATEYSSEDADVTLRLHQALHPAPGGGAAPGGALPRHRDAGDADPLPHGKERRAGGCRAAGAGRGSSSACA